MRLYLSNIDYLCPVQGRAKKAAKLCEFSLNFPKFADWLCMGWSVCQAAAKAGNSNRGNFFLHQPVQGVPSGRAPRLG